MSYILEALKKSSEERARLTATEAKANEVVVAHYHASQTSFWSRRMIVAMGGLAGLIILALLWIEIGQSDQVQAHSTHVTEPPKPGPITVNPVPALVAASEFKQKPAPALPPPEKIAPTAQAKPVDAVPAPTMVNTPASAANNSTEMPPDLLKQVLAIPILAHMYAEKPAERMVVIEGRATREGEVLPSGIMIEQITPTGITVSYKGYRTNRPVH